jgi:lauroyl/myristoyl acyltransferase
VTNFEQALSQACTLLQFLDEASAGADKRNGVNVVAALPADWGDADKAAALLRELIVQFPARWEPYRLLFKLYLSQELWQDAAEVASLSDNANLRVSVGHELFQHDRFEEALAVLDQARGLVSDDATRFWHELATAKALDALGREQEAITLYNRAALAKPDDWSILQRLTIHDREQGLWPQCRPRLRELQKLRAPLLPPSLAEELRAIQQQPRKSRSVTPAVTWAWEHADQQRWVKEDWLTAVEHGTRMHALLREWWRWAPERADEIMALVEPPDLAPIREALAQGCGCILACAHVGEQAAGVEFLQRSGLPFTSIGFAGSERAHEVERERRIILTTNRFANARALVDRLKAGDAIAWSVDSPVGETVTLEFLGRPLKVLAAAPRYAARYAGSSFWCQSLWRGDRIVIDIERLPDPAAGESDDDWTRRWYSAYLAKLEGVIRGDPRNLVCQNGMWFDFSSARRFGAAQALLARTADRLRRSFSTAE